MSVTAAFAEALEKHAGQKAKDTALGAAVGTSLGALGVLLAYKGTRAQALAQLKGLGRGGARAVDEAKELPPAVVALAKDIAEGLRARGVDPEEARIAVSATGGTGKSVLSRALSAELGVGYKDLDVLPSGITGRDVGRYIDEHGIPKGSLVEQTHLLSRVDPKHYGVAIHLEKPEDVVRAQLLKRGRGAWQHDYYNQKRIQDTIRTAFDTLEGDVFSPAPGVRVKIAEGGAFDGAALDQLLAQQRIDGKGLSREQKLVSVVLGARKDATPSYHYVDKSAVLGVGAALGTGAGAGALAGNQAR